MEYQLMNPIKFVDFIIEQAQVFDISFCSISLNIIFNETFLHD